MNPLRDHLNRLGFLIWSIVIGSAIYLILVARSNNWINIGEGSGTVGHGVALVLLVILLLLTVLVMVRRLQSARLPSVLAALLLVPGIGFIAWAVLFIIPERAPVTE